MKILSWYFQCGENVLILIKILDSDKQKRYVLSKLSNGGTKSEQGEYAIKTNSELEEFLLTVFGKKKGSCERIDLVGRSFMKHTNTHANVSMLPHAFLLDVEDQCLWTEPIPTNDGSFTHSCCRNATQSAWHAKLNSSCSINTKTSYWSKHGRGADVCLRSAATQTNALRY